MFVWEKEFERDTKCILRARLCGRKRMRDTSNREETMEGEREWNKVRVRTYM